MENISKKILIVEDDSSISKALELALVKEGFLVALAANGEIGLEKIVSEKPDLILLDIIMPVMDGWEMLKKMRGMDEKVNNLPVIMLTNLSADNEEVIEKVVEAKPLHYIIKSNTQIKDVIAKVRELLG